MNEETHPPTQRLAEGTLLSDRYEILEIVGRGGMGTVYRARDRRLDTQVAVKEMREPVGEEESREAAVRQFEREAKLLAQLNHPHLPRVTDYFVQGQRWYLIMEFVQGTTLDKLVRKATPGTLPLNDILKWGAQIADVLAYLHQQDPPIVFRDVKPANVMIQDSGDVKLIDFGIARRFQHGAAKDTLLYGSPGYSPPEQYGRTQTDPRSDVYALGATLHHLLSGHDPAGSPFKFASLSTYDPTLPPALVDLVGRCVDLDIEKRVDDAAHIRDVLLRVRSAVAAAHPAQPHQSEKSPATPAKRIVSARLESASRRRSRPRVGLVVLGIGTVTVLVAVGFALIRRPQAPKPLPSAPPPAAAPAQPAPPNTPVAVVRPTALVVSSSPPAARVFIEGRQVGVTPCEIARLAAGHHVLRLEPASTEFLPALVSVHIQDGQVLPIQITFESAQPPQGASRSPVVQLIHVAEAIGQSPIRSPASTAQPGALITAAVRVFGAEGKRLTLGAFFVDRATGQSLPAVAAAPELRDKLGNLAVFADFDIEDRAVDVRNVQLFVPASALPSPSSRAAYRLVAFLDDEPVYTSDLRVLP